MIATAVDPSPPAPALPDTRAAAKPLSNSNSNLLRIKQAAAILNLSYSKTHELVTQDKIPNVRIPGTAIIRVPRDLLEEFLRQHTHSKGAVAPIVDADPPAHDFIEDGIPDDRPVKGPKKRAQQKPTASRGQGRKKAAAGSAGK